MRRWLGMSVVIDVASSQVIVTGLLVAILLLHGPTGREIRLNSRTVTSLHGPQSGQRNTAIAEGANCLINTTDGKFISVVETCAAVTHMIEGAK